ncbi:MAG: hypothetical protein UX61_C0032G0005 [Parcubacteria group bacterium GW2011_GWA2_46_7]|nr:MAG: hypothetical protein UX61_C0032G0005 [Parcubacteria group bacterium GW2011_GWA2_46_7]
MDPIQLTIIAVTITLTILLVILGIQVFYILKEIRLSIQKANKMLDDAGAVTGTVSEGITSMSGFINGIKSGISLITSLKKKTEDHE